LQKFLIAAAAASAITGIAPAFAQAPIQLATATAVSGFGRSGEVVPNVAPGDEIVVACAPIEQRDANSDVRVVLTIAAVPSESSPGFKKVLATDEQLSKYGVRVRVPNVPELPEHTVNLNVYVVGEQTHDCDGGHLKVVAKHLPDFRRQMKSAPVS